jgi:SAM-dependent methyltransferase
VLTGEPSTDRSNYAGRDWALNANRAGVLDKIRFQAFDASKLPFESEAFDAVFFFGVLHHVSEHLRGDVFREALRVSKRDGVVVFFEPRKEMLERLWVDDPGHPLAVNPSNYLPDRSIHEHRVGGSFMISLFTRKPRPRTLAIDDQGYTTGSEFGLARPSN